MVRAAAKATPALRLLKGTLSGPRLWLTTLSLSLLAFTFALPSLDLSRDHYRFVFVFDITQSMNVRDADGSASVSRLEFAKSSVAVALRRFPCGSDVGLGVFTQHRALLMFSPVEVCEHYDEMIKSVVDLDWKTAWRARSEVSKGLYSALGIMEQMQDPAHLVFLTDGHEAPPVHRELRPRFSGTPGANAGLIVGVGGTTPVPIPKFNNVGDAIGTWEADEVLQVDVYSTGRNSSVKDEVLVGVDRTDVARRIASGTEHLSALRENYLLELASEVGLAYHRLSSPDQLARTLMQPRFGYSKRTARDIRWVFGSLALLCLLASYLPKEERSPAAHSRRENRVSG